MEGRTSAALKSDILFITTERKMRKWIGTAVPAGIW
jgi:hypothetical protein